MKHILRRNRQIHHLIIKQFLQNSSNLTHASTDDLLAEKLTLKSFVVDQIYMFKKKSEENQI